MTLDEIVRVCQMEFCTLVKEASVVDHRRNRIRLTLIDGSFVDINQNANGRYSYHWERNGEFIRFNNAPHFDQIETAPHHFHDSNRAVLPSPIQGVTENDVRKVLKFIQSKLVN